MQGHLKERLGLEQTCTAGLQNLTSLGEITKYEATAWAQVPHTDTNVGINVQVCFPNQSYLLTYSMVQSPS